jgi:hypothetical protein
VNDFCVLASPFRPDPGFDSRWTLGEKRQALTLNKLGEGRCGWKAGAS